MTTEAELGITDVPPVPVADDKKTEAAPAAEPPASDADAEKTELEDKTESKPEETPEQVEQRKESRRARSNARKAAELAAAKTEARMLREQLERAQPRTQQDAEPKREQFEDYGEYVEAKAVFKAEQKTAEILKADREARQGSEKQTQETQAQQRLAQDWNKREQDFVKGNADYEKTVTPFVDEELQTYSKEAKSAIVESEVGPALLHYLATHLEDSDRIAGLSPSRQLVELGKIEIKMTTKRTSSAPEPARPSAGRTTVTKDLNKMSDQEYWEARKARNPRWG